MYPARQLQLAIDALPGAESVWTGQAVQNVLPEVGLYRPDSHVVQEEFAALVNLPGTHAWHTVDTFSKPSLHTQPAAELPGALIALLGQLVQVEAAEAEN